MGNIVGTLLFQPPEKPTKITYSPTNSTIKVRVAWIKTYRNSCIPIVHITTREAYFTLLYSHGNAEDLGMITDFLVDLAKILHVNILAYDYTGYGFSNNCKLCHSNQIDTIDPKQYRCLTTDFTEEETREPAENMCRGRDCEENVAVAAGCDGESGRYDDFYSPSEMNCYSDITSCYLYITNILKIPPKRIILFGRSLGSGPSCYLANKLHSNNFPTPLGGMILHSAFASIFRVVLDLGQQTLAPDKFPNIDRIARIPPTCPVFIMHGTEDEIVPFSHANALYHALPTSCRCNPFFAEGLGHNNMESDSPKLFVRRLMEYLQRVRRVQDIASPSEQSLISQEEKEMVRSLRPFFQPLPKNIKRARDILNADRVTRHSKCMMNDEYMIKMFHRKHQKRCSSPPTTTRKNFNINVCGAIETEQEMRFVVPPATFNQREASKLNKSDKFRSDVKKLTKMLSRSNQKRHLKE